jgi:hypothetical protein
MTRKISIVALTQSAVATAAIIDGLLPRAVEMLVGEPTYPSPLKVVRFLPLVIVMELPEKFHAHLHFFMHALPV